MDENGDSLARGRIARLIDRVDNDPRLLKLVRFGRSRLPGDERYGDPLSLTGDHAPAVLGRPSLASAATGRAIYTRILERVATRVLDVPAEQIAAVLATDGEQPGTPA